MGISAKVIKSSQFGDTTLTTVEVEFHRFILPELNTHRVFSRNYQSSRAVPIEKMIEQVRNSPALPVHWGKNQRGMVAQEEQNKSVYLWAVGTETTPDRAWKSAANQAANSADGYNKAGYHKQIVNRLLEPFMWTKGVITATDKGWESFFKLRSHKDAQPEIHALSLAIEDAMNNRFIEVMSEGDWHLPYVNHPSDYDNIEDAIKVSTSCCAQVSYRTLDDSLDKAKRIYDLLNLPEGGKFKEDPAHMSPCEHVAVATSEWQLAEDFGLLYSPTDCGGNFNTLDFFQYRKMLEFGDEKNILKG